MRLTKEQLEELTELARPISEFIKKHGCPHNTVFVTQEGVTAVEDIAFNQFKEQPISIRKVD